MLSYLERCRAELNEINTADDMLKHLSQAWKSQLPRTKEKASALSALRKQAAIKLEKRILSELSQLDMPRVRFSVEFSGVPGADGLDQNGMDSVKFLMSANLGEALKPIQKVASGGELARIMLALKNVLAETDEIYTLIFDEIDAGVSGRAARRVGEKLLSVSRGKQVLCVTHLPQIAALADAHFQVEKGEQNGRTFTKVEKLAGDNRIAEIARLLSGDRVTEQSMKNAEEMLRQTAEIK